MGTGGTGGRGGVCLGLHGGQWWPVVAVYLHHGRGGVPWPWCASMVSSSSVVSVMASTASVVSSKFGEGGTGGRGGHGKDLTHLLGLHWWPWWWSPRWWPRWCASVSTGFAMVAVCGVVVSSSLNLSYWLPYLGGGGVW